MKISRLLLTVLVLGVFALIWNGLVHMVILKEANIQVAVLHRPNAANLMWLSIVLTFLIGFLFVWGYSKWCRSFSRRETVGYSLFFALLAGVLVNLNQYVVYPVPGALAATWFAFGIAEFLVYGQISRLLLKPRK